ncbi:alpha/beta fold hydrolase [Streptomyces corynorhini]|uniref:alpha/beta fold hydrolase n=1 Tax=Streptomyces corynorhini TaxID=2282652 RepID=UPI001F255B04|nr:alpha/beta fold hydrolase [Streptomyces corynorhini]
MPTTPLSEALLHAHDHGGDGPPLVLLHGSGRSRADWTAVAPLLTHRHRVLAVDLPGHGGSEHTEGPWSFDGAVAALERVLVAYGMPDALPVGHSLGGMVALHHAARRGGRSGGDGAGAPPGAVDLDGFWWGRPEQYPGLDREAVVSGLARIGELIRSAAGQIAEPDHSPNRQRTRACSAFRMRERRPPRAVRSGNCPTAASRHCPYANGRWRCTRRWTAST